MKTLEELVALADALDNKTAPQEVSAITIAIAAHVKTAAFFGTLKECAGCSGLLALAAKHPDPTISEIAQGLLHYGEVPS